MKEKLPKGWGWRTLGDITTNYDGIRIPIKKEDRQSIKGIYPYYGASGIIDYVNDYLFDGEYLLIGEDGANLLARSTQIAFKASGKFWVNNHAHILKPSENVFLSFLSYYINSIDLQKYVTGTAQPKLTQKSMNTINIPLPPLDVQQKIVSILEKAEETKRLRAQADEQTQQLLKSVFLEMFGDPVRNEKEWEIRKMSDFGTIKTGNTPSRKVPEYYGNFLEWIKSDNINTPYTFLTKSEEMLSESGANVGRIVPEGAILVTCIAGSLSCIGNAAITNRKVAFNQQINAIIPNESTNTFFLYHLILCSKKYIQDFSTQSMKGMLSKGTFESIPFILPPIELQNQFGDIAKHIEKIREQQIQSSQEINTLFASLMQKAFTGELVS